MQNLNVAEAKRRFSELLNEVVYHKERILIERHGKPVAALVNLEELGAFSPQKETSRKGLLAAIGAWEDYPDIDGMIEALYRTRTRAKERPFSF